MKQVTKISYKILHFYFSVFPVNCHRNSNDNDVAAMLVGLTKEAIDEYFVNANQHGDHNITSKPSVGLLVYKIDLE